MGKLNTMIARPDKKVKRTVKVVINVKIFYKMIPYKMFELILITEIERVRSVIGRAFHNLANLQK